MTLNGAMALLRYFTEFTYNVVLKQLLGLHPFQNLLLIVYDHINYDLRDYSASRPYLGKTTGGNSLEFRV